MLHHPDGCALENRNWLEVYANIDWRVAAALESYEEAVGGLTGDDWAAGYRTLAFDGRDPYYAAKAVPPVYAIRYLVQRMTTILSGLDRLVRKRNIPSLQRVVDIGSGLDSVSLALDLSQLMDSAYIVHCIELSDMMIDFAQRIEMRTIRHHFSEDYSMIKDFRGVTSIDAAFLSYAFGYQHAKQTATIKHLIDNLVSELTPGGFIFYSGAAGQTKTIIADEVRASLRSHEDIQIEELHDDWPDHLQQRYNMPRLRNIFQTSVVKARDRGLEDDIWFDLHNPGTGSLSVIYTNTRKSNRQHVFAGIKTN